MSERMTSADAAFLHRETRTAPQHIGGLAVFAPPPGGFEYDRLVRLLEERISLAPRYRQKVRAVPGHLGNPVWLDDPGFDITYHVRRSALPRPGNERQLLEFCGRVQSRLLDRSHPLWEMYLVEGLSDGRVAIVTKTHEAMVAEDDGIDLAQVILDASPAPRRTVEAIWMPAPEPGSLQLIRNAARDLVRSPSQVVDTARGVTRDVHSLLARATSVAGGAASAVSVVSAGRAVLRKPDPSPLHADLCEQRRLAIARTRLADYRSVRAAVGGTVNDVVLAVVAGALRGWLLSRAQAPAPGSAVRALVPVAVGDLVEPGAGAPRARTAVADHPARGGRAEPGPTGRIRPLLVDLPVGEGDPLLRLAQLRYRMASHSASGRAVAADRLVGLSGFAPPTLHALGARAASGLAGRLYQVVVTNVPGPQLPLYASGARMTEMFPIVPLAPGQPVSIGLTSYDGGVFYGINGDRDAVRDVATIAELLEESLAELVDATVTAAGAGVRVARSHRFPDAAGSPGSAPPAGSGGGLGRRQSGSTGQGRPPTTRGGARGTDEP